MMMSSSKPTYWITFLVTHGRITSMCTMLRFTCAKMARAARQLASSSCWLFSTCPPVLCNAALPTCQPTAAMVDAARAEHAPRACACSRLIPP